jgi:hypothetical protein
MLSRQSTPSLCSLVLREVHSGEKPVATKDSSIGHTASQVRNQRGLL